MSNRFLYIIKIKLHGTCRLNFFQTCEKQYFTCSLHSSVKYFFGFTTCKKKTSLCGKERQHHLLPPPSTHTCLRRNLLFWHCACSCMFKWQSVHTLDFLSKNALSLKFKRYIYLKPHYFFPFFYLLAFIYFLKIMAMLTCQHICFLITEYLFYLLLVRFWFCFCWESKQQDSHSWWCCQHELCPSCQFSCPGLNSLVSWLSAYYTRWTHFSWQFWKN